jgi:trehalose 6-phosphate phosphatase
MAKQCALFLDFDGTLVGFRNRPEDVRVPVVVNRTLERLARHKNLFVALVSGRNVWDLLRLLKVKGVRYFGLHGAEEEEKSRELSHEANLALSAARLYTRLWLRDLPKIWVEDKGLTFAVHFRGATPATVHVVKKLLFQALDPFHNTLRLLEGDNVWEILPAELRDKGANVQSLMQKLPRHTLGIYIGDDATDEPAFEALREGITIRVGKPRTTAAAYRQKKPATVLNFLSRLEKELV